MCAFLNMNRCTYHEQTCFSFDKIVICFISRNHFGWTDDEWLFIVHRIDWTRLEWQFIESMIHAEHRQFELYGNEARIEDGEDDRLGSKTDVSTGSAA